MATLDLADKPCVCSRERERVGWVFTFRCRGKRERERFVCPLYRMVKVTWPIFIGISVSERGPVGRAQLVFVKRRK